MSFNVNFQFSREPSVSVSVQIQAAGLVANDNTLVIIGRRAAATPAVAQVESLTVPAAADREGVLLQDDVGSVALIIDLDGAGNALPAWASAADRLIDVNVATGTSDVDTAIALAAALDADSKFSVPVPTTATMVITHSPVGARGDITNPGSYAGYSFVVDTDGSDEVDPGTATTGEAVQIENMGDVTALQTEVDGLFGTGSEIGAMLVAAAKSAAFTDLDPVFLPPTQALPLDEDTPDLENVLAANSTLPMPFAAVGFSATDSTNRIAFQNHLVSISRSDRGEFGQFGSFGFMGGRDTIGVMTPIGEGSASQVMLYPYLRDSAVSPSQTDAEQAAAVAILCAANPIPYNPLNDVIVGGLVPPVDKSDYHTPGTSGTISTSLAAGLLPLKVDAGGRIRITRTVTASRRVASVADANYFDQQDWAVLYLIRINAFNLAKQPQFVRAKASAQKVNALRSGIIAVLRALEGLEMLQFVDELADQVTVRQDPTNRSAFIYTVPVNVIPGFHNKGIGIIGTTEFDGTIVG